MTRGLNRFGNKRDANEPEIVAALERMGCLVERMDKPCDLLVRLGRETLLCEVKMPRGKRTKDQEDFEARGWEVWTLRDVTDAVNMVKTIRRAAA